MDGSRGFGMGRGRGRAAGGFGNAQLLPGYAPAARAVGTGGGVGGRMRWGPSKASHRYPTDQLAKVYKQMLYAGRCAAGLALPAS
jgi:hypothetical protein